VSQWTETVDGSPAFAQLRKRILELAAPVTSDRSLDLGAGTGFLSLPLAHMVVSVHATDLSSEMMLSLRAKAERAGAPITTLVADMAQLDFPASSYDLIVSSYAMHYLTDADKQSLLRKMHSWVAPGGRIVLADMMVGRKLDHAASGTGRMVATSLERRSHRQRQRTASALSPRLVDHRSQ